MKRIVLAVCCVALAAVAASAQEKSAGKKSAGAPMTDQQFVDFAAQTDMVEANLGQLAADAASSQPIKDYGQMLAADHTADFKQLSDIARQANLTMPSAIDEEHNKAMIAPFHKLQGAALDHKYATEMVAGHTKAIAIYKKEADDAQNAALKSYAQQALPFLQKHLDGAKDLGKKPAPK
jgi:putative membrane protein